MQGARADATSGPARLELEPFTLRAAPGQPGAEPSIEVLEAGGLFERAGSLLSARKYRDALAHYDRLLKVFPDSRFVSPALYNAGLAHEWLGEFAAAAARYSELVRRFGASKDALDAAFRLGGCHAERGRWADSATVFQVILQRGELSAPDRLEALARKGLAHFRFGDEQAARATLEEAVRFHAKVEALERLESDFFVAMARYYLAALPHVRFRNLKVDSGPDLARTLDEKARLLLESQARYIATIKVKNPYWAAAAGFQVGSLYREFYTVLLTTLPDFTKQAARNARLAGIPEREALEQLVGVYQEEVHKVVKPLLEKAVRVFEKNVLMAERVGVQSDWVGKSRHQINELRHLLGLSPAAVVQLVNDQRETVPEDAPAAASAADAEPGQISPDGFKRPADVDQAPARPPERPEEPSPDEPGRVIL